MPRGRKAKMKGGIGTAGSDYERRCSEWKHNKIISIGLILILLGFAVKVGWSVADLLLLAGAIFVVKGLIISMKK